MATKSAFFVEKPQDSLGFLLWKNTTTWQRQIKAALLPYDVTHAQFVIMAATRWFHETKQKPTQVSIGDFTRLDKMTVSSSLKKLVAMGLVSRIEDQHDTRAKIVALSPKGNKLIEKLVVVVEEIDQQYFSGLTKTEQKLLKEIFCKLSAKNIVRVELTRKK